MGQQLAIKSYSELFEIVSKDRIRDFEGKV